MRSNSIIFMLLVFIGFLTAAAESNAQVVPPRSQTLQMIRPTTPPPVPPLQEEIGQVKKDVQAKTQALERKIGITFPPAQAEWPKPKPPSPGGTIKRMLEAEKRMQDEIKQLQKRVKRLEQEIENRKGR